jgi:hypothetical protein
VDGAGQLERLAAGAAPVDGVGRVAFDRGDPTTLGTRDQPAADAAVGTEGVRFVGQVAIVPGCRFGSATAP